MSLSLYQQRFDALPGLFRQLMQAPLRPLLQGTLPVPEAVYVFYRGGEPVRVGSLPHIDALSLLGPSVRLGFMVQKIPSDPHLIEIEPQPDPATVWRARWLSLPEARDRALLEVYVAEYLGIAPSHPSMDFLAVPAASRPTPHGAPTTGL